MPGLEFNSSQISECPNLRFLLLSLLEKIRKAEVSAPFCIDVYLEIFYFLGFLQKKKFLPRSFNIFFKQLTMSKYFEASLIFFIIFLHVSKNNSSNSSSESDKHGGF